MAFAFLRQAASTAFLSLVDGVVVASFLEDKKGQRYSTEKDKLIQLDSEKGPFAWSFHPAAPPKIIPAQQSPSTSQPLSLRHISSQNMERQMPIFADSRVARIVAPLEMGSLGDKWTIAQKQMLLMVWRLIDGRRTLREIKTILGSSLSETTVDEILSVLVKLKVITIGL